MLATCSAGNGYTGSMTHAPTPSETIYEHVMGTQFARLAPAVQRFHRLSGLTELHGQVRTYAPSSAAGRLLAKLLGTPRGTSQGPLKFVLNASSSVESWTRYFPINTMTSQLRARGPRLEEHLGAARLLFDLVECRGALHMKLTALRFLGVPCPQWLLPTIKAVETGQGSQLHFHITASLPLIGEVASYAGFLTIPGENS